MWHVRLRFVLALLNFILTDALLESTNTRKTVSEQTRKNSRETVGEQLTNFKRIKIRRLLPANNMYYFNGVSSINDI